LCGCRCFGGVIYVGSNIGFYAYIGFVFFVCFRWCVFFEVFLFFYGSIKNTILLLGNKGEFCWIYFKYVVVFLFFGSIENTIPPKSLSGEET
jgi:hypothetical protein